MGLKDEMRRSEELASGMFMFAGCEKRSFCQRTTDMKQTNLDRHTSRNQRNAAGWLRENNGAEIPRERSFGFLEIVGATPFKRSDPVP